MAERSLYMNPRCGATLVDEHFMGSIKEICQSCSHGTASHMIPEKVMFKHEWLMHCHMVYASAA
eukprot:7693965-Pyramimonas_sp.AAC.1